VRPDAADCTVSADKAKGGLESKHLFALGNERLRAYGDSPLAVGRHWLELPRRELWIF